LAVNCLGFIIGGTLVATCSALLDGWSTYVNAPIAPTQNDLEQAYRHDLNFASHQQAEGVVVSAEGITVLCSGNLNGEGEHSWLIQLADSGSIRWEREYAPDQGAGRAIAAVPGGGFVIAGDVKRGTAEYQAHLMHVSADGGVIADGAFGLQGVTGFVTVAVLNDGSTLAGGTTRWRGWMVRTGDALRVNRDWLMEQVDDVQGIAPLSDGGFALVANTDKSTSGLGLAYFAAFANDGSPRWQKQLPSSGRGELMALAAFTGGSLVVVGHRATGEHDTAQLWVVRVDAAGTTMWERLLRAPNKEQRGRAVVTLPEGGIAVAGEAQQQGQRDVRVLRLSADGTTIWERSYGKEQGYNMVRGLARTDDGGLVLVGSTTKGSDKTNPWILRCDGDGRLLWSRVLNLSHK
jgi:outer membrane protein assembly factor BamB